MVNAYVILSAAFLINVSLLTTVKCKSSRNSNCGPSKHSNLNVRSTGVLVLAKNQEGVKRKVNRKEEQKRKEEEKEADLSGFRLIRNKVSKIKSLRLPFQKEKIAPVVVPAIVVKPPSSLAKINVLMLLFYTTLGAAMPFIPLYYKHIGIPNDKVGLLGAITPAITFFVSPLWGALADSTGRHKYIMLLTFVGSVVARSALALTDGKTSIIYILLIVAVSAVLNAPVKPLMDSAVMSMLADKSDYGRSRVYGQIGFGLGSYLVGPFINKKIEYIFYFQLLFAIPTAILMAGFQPVQSEKKKEKLDVFSAINHMVSDPNVLVFFFMVFLIGVSSGIVENFAYMRMAEVGGNKGNVLGICRLLSSLAGGPMFWLSGAISKRIGVNGVLNWSLVSYVLRLFIYASIQNPWQAIPAEILRGTTFAVFWAASTYYVYSAAPDGLTATMLSIFHGVYGGLGQSVGALIGGGMAKYHGISKTFYICGVVDFAVLSLFVLYQVRLSLYSQTPPNAQSGSSDTKSRSPIEAKKEDKKSKDNPKIENKKKVKKDIEVSKGDIKKASSKIKGSLFS